MTPRWYGAVVALAALSATSACADRSQVAGTQSVASIAAPTALSRPSGGPTIMVATAPAPPPPTEPAPGPATSAPAPRPTAAASVTASAPPASGPPAPTEAPDPTTSAVLGPPGGDQPGPDGELYSKHAAQLRLDADLAGLHLPPGAVRQSTPLPKAVTQSSSYIGLETAALDTWWSLPGTAADVITYLKSHPPTGFGIANINSTLTLHGESGLEFVPLASKGPQTLFEAGIAQDGERVDIRVQLQVGYLPTRTAIETIPASVSTGSAVYQPPTWGLPNNATPAPRRTATLSAADVRVIADALNGVDARSPIEHSCPAPSGEEAWFTFRYSGHTVVFHVALNGCGGVVVTADGVPQPELSLGEAVFNGVEKSLHVTKKENPELSVAQ